MAAWVKEEEKASGHRQGKTEAEETNKVEAAPRVTVGSLRRFRAVLTGLDRPKDFPSGVGCVYREARKP